MEVLVTICARGGSKGIPGKNIKLLAGKPLIGYTVEVAEKISETLKADIFLSTDDHKIKDAVVSKKVYMDYIRPEALATDTAGKIEVIADLLRYAEKNFKKKYDFILDLDVTSPLRTLNDLTLAFEQIKTDDNALTIFSVNKANRNPYFNMVEDAGNGYVRLVKTLPEIKTLLTRQSAPVVYDLNASFYWYRRSFFESDLLTPITDKSLAYVMHHICFDLDHSIDFDFLDYLIKEGKLDFML